MQQTAATPVALSANVGGPLGILASIDGMTRQHKDNGIPLLPLWLQT